MKILSYKTKWQYSENTLKKGNKETPPKAREIHVVAYFHVRNLQLENGILERTSQTGSPPVM